MRRQYMRGDGRWVVVWDDSEERRRLGLQTLKPRAYEFQYGVTPNGMNNVEAEDEWRETLRTYGVPRGTALMGEVR